MLPARSFRGRRRLSPGALAYGWMALFQRIRGWWNKDEVARAEEETRMTEAERDIAEEDYEARKDDVATRSGLLGGGAADYERDNEPPRP
jgi:hypothetical protein